MRSRDGHTMARETKTDYHNNRYERSLTEKEMGRIRMDEKKTIMVEVNSIKDRGIKDTK